MIPMLIGNMASGLFSMYQNLRGPNFATCSACATANHAIGEAWRTIKMGDAQIMFAGGAEADHRAHRHRRLLRDAAP
jgi:3-oxoacyl-[acyl-carrier-protein] synthase II